MASTARAAADGGVVVSSVRSTAASMSSCVMRCGAGRWCSHRLALSRAASSAITPHRLRSWRRDTVTAGLPVGCGWPPWVVGGGAATGLCGSAGGRRAGRELL